MARRVFISFRFNDGSEYKEELANIFNDSTEIVDCSEDEDRTGLTEESIKTYLYGKLSTTSVTIVILTPNALNHQKDAWGDYDDWMYDEIRYSLEDRTNNRTNGLIAVYTPEAESFIVTKSTHSCAVCNTTKEVITINDIDNLARKNMMNVYDEYKKTKCVGVYDAEWDSYCRLVSWEDFIDDYETLIDNAVEKREQLYKYDIKKRL